MTQNTDGTPQAPPRSTLDDLFGRLRGSGFYRDTDRRWFGGVCAGLAARYRIDPLLIRAAAIILAFAGGLGLTAYLVLWLILPDRSGDLLLERALRRGDGWPVVLVVVTAFVLVGGLVSIGQGGGWGTSLWVLLPIALIAWLVIDRGRGRGTPWATGTAPPPAPTEGSAPAPSSPTDPSPPAATTAGTPPTPTGGTSMSTPTPALTPGASPPPTPPPYGAPGPRPTQTAPYGAPPPPVPPRPVAPPPPPGPRRRRPNGFVGLMALGLALALFGIGVALDGPLGFPGAPAVLGFALALAGVSVLALALGGTGRAGGFTSVLVIALGFLLVTSAAASRVHVADGIGDRTWTPTTVSGTTSYGLGAGDATLDLRRLQDTGTVQTAEIDVNLGAGDLTIIVPDSMTARVSTHVGIGDIRVEGAGVATQQASGSNRSISTVVGSGAVPDVVVTADVGVGQITVRSAPGLLTSDLDQN